MRWFLVGDKRRDERASHLDWVLCCFRDSDAASYLDSFTSGTRGNYLSAISLPARVWSMLGGKTHNLFPPSVTNLNSWAVTLDSTIVFSRFSNVTQVHDNLQKAA
jgi:hypothetical protein